VHGDIKPENLLLDQKGRKDQMVKLADFGSTFHTSTTSERKKRIPVTVSYSPPEYFVHMEEDKHAPSDMWAFGVVIAIMLLRYCCGISLLAEYFVLENPCWSFLYWNVVRAD
jgi:serine/threonine protein kinase